jgi:hypothetical protein
MGTQLCVRVRVNTDRFALSVVANIGRNECV